MQLRKYQVAFALGAMLVASPAAAQKRSLVVANSTAATPAVIKAARSSSPNVFSLSCLDPQTSSARWPKDLANTPMSARRPQPNTIRGGAKKS